MALTKKYLKLAIRYNNYVNNTKAKLPLEFDEWLTKQGVNIKKLKKHK